MTLKDIEAIDKDMLLANDVTYTPLQIDLAQFGHSKPTKWFREKYCLTHEAVMDAYDTVCGHEKEILAGVQIEDRPQSAGHKSKFQLNRMEKARTKYLEIADAITNGGMLQKQAAEKFHVSNGTVCRAMKYARGDMP